MFEMFHFKFSERRHVFMKCFFIAKLCILKSLNENFEFGLHTVNYEAALFNMQCASKFHNKRLDGDPS
jgi:hypothetical protein